MAVYPNLLTTNAGMDLISRSNATGKGINYTHVALGDGEIGTNNIMTMRNLISPKMAKLEITSKNNLGNGHYEIEAQVDNSSLNTGFWAREMGVFAKCEGDDDSAIVLFAYTNGGNYVPYVNDKTRPDIQLCQVNMVVGNATNLDAIIDPKTYVTNARLTSVLNDHNVATNAHANLFNKYLPLAGGTMAGDLNVLNKALTDNSRSAASTKFVRDLLNSFMTKGQTNFSNFKTAMAGAVEYDYSNPNAWWRKEPDGLIIQGGATGRPTNNAVTVNFAIAFNNTDYTIITNGVIDASDSKWDMTVNVLKDYKTVNSCAFRTSDAIAPACYYMAFGK